MIIQQALLCGKTTKRLPSIILTLFFPQPKNLVDKNFFNVYNLIELSQSSYYLQNRGILPLTEKTSNSHKPINRREMLKKGALAASGAITAAAFLDGKWLKPVVKTGVLPVHAQASVVAVPALPAEAI